MTTITLACNRTGWTATWKGDADRAHGVPAMPQGVPIPLPFSPAATFAAVHDDLRQRFPGASINQKDLNR